MFSKAICERIFSFLGPSVLQRPFRVVFADGTKYQNYDGSKNPEIEIVFKNAKGQRRLILEGYVGFFESYINSDIDLNGDRKSTRLNSSHMSISYAVFCLKK